MNKEITSKEDILQICRGIAATQGFGKITMRAIAQECGIALGTLYNYYPNKDDLLIAAVKSIWEEIFPEDKGARPALSFPDYAARLFACARNGTTQYPNFLTVHSMVLAKSPKGHARNAMEQYFNHMKTGMLEVLQSDPKVSRTAFSPDFPQSAFIDFVLDNILLLLMQDAENCTGLTEIIRRVIYPRTETV